jgi:hypothetical protein
MRMTLTTGAHPCPWALRLVELGNCCIGRGLGDWPGDDQTHHRPASTLTTTAKRASTRGDRAAARQ